MNQYGILGRYLPEFGRIVGQMQHDLFHVYTVDQHILMVLRNLRRFTMPEFAHEYPLCSRADERLRAPLAAVRRGALPRHRQGPRRRPFARSARSTRGASAGGTASRARTPSWSRSWSSTTSPCPSVAQKQDVDDPEVVQRLRRRSSAASGAWSRCTCSPSPTSAAPARRSGTPGRRSCWRTCSARRAAADGRARWRATPRMAGEAGRGDRACCGSTRCPTRSRTALGATSTPPTSCATTRRKSPGRRATCTTASIRRQPVVQARASRRSARACR